MSPATPADLQRILDFVNTHDVEAGTDALADAAALREWLVSRELLAASSEVTDADLREARSVREALRRALLAHDDHGAEADRTSGALVSVPLQLTIDAAGGASIAPAEQGVAGALARLLAGVPAAQADGSWHRAKVCRNDTCLWAFYDQSRNRSRRWCSMEVCGNRVKTRTFRQRQQGD